MWRQPRHWAGAVLGPEWGNPRRAPFWLLVLLVAGLAIRVWYLSRGFDWFVSFFSADDFYYYAGTAINVVQGHGASCDGGLTHHNGFHPLFLVLQLAPAALGIGKTGLVYWSVAVLVVSWLTAAVLAYRLGVRWGCPAAALCVPAAMMLNIQFVRISLSGFETALAAALVLAVLHALAYESRGWVVGLLLGLAGLARVELLAAAVPVFLALAGRRRWRDLAAAAAVSLVMMLPWFAWSWSGFRSLLPLSGVAKMSDFAAERFWTGFEVYCRALPAALAGLELKPILPAPAAFAIGVVVLGSLLRDWRRTGWATSLVLLLLLMYGGFTNPAHEPQFLRYCVPAFLVSGIAAFGSLRRAPAVIPAAIAVASVVWSWSFYSWSARTGVVPTYVALGQSRIPAILDELAGPGDIVGCFDSGAIAYFSRVPVVNLDGLVNAEVVRMLQGEEGGTWTRRYQQYFAEKGITIIVGGDRYSWVRLFPDLEQWPVLHEPLQSTDGGRVLFLKAPATGAS